ncbi:MAG: glycine zipper 2TM domain-containing protein [Burkholderiales bacterium]|nr:glycine zipper 2TM domain-containing protein [Burkholderiales bacterium]
MNRIGLPHPANILAISALALTTAACAGPRVGEVIGNPSSSRMTIQARVVSSSPVVAQVAVPRQVCYDELRQEPARSSGAGAIMGAIAGGAMGNAVGKGSGRAVTTGLGVILGAAMGDRIESDGRPGVTRSVQRCEQQNTYQNQVVAYNVVYEYGGQRYSTQMQREPGATIPVTVTVNPGDQGSYNGYSQQPYSYYQPAQPVIVAPAVTRYVVQPAPVAQVVYNPGVVVRGWDRGDRWGHRGYDRDDRDERCEERDERREHHGYRDDGRATFVGRWN